MSAAQDEETQIKGQATVIYNVCDNWLDTFDHVLFQGVATVREALPIREVSVHYCYTDPKFGAAVAFISRVFEADTRTRSRLHRGTHLEVQYELLGFGIPSSALPFNSDGVIRRKDHLNFLKMRRAQEERIQNGEMDLEFIIVPSGNDVLFGRGKPVQSHKGNLRLAFLVEEQLGAYLVGGRKEKIAIAKCVHQAMKKDSARFLRQDDDGVYIEVDEKTALNKIEHFFRNRKQSLPNPSLATSATTKAASASSKRASTGVGNIDPRSGPSPVAVSEDEDDAEASQDFVMLTANKRSRA